MSFKQNSDVIFIFFFVSEKFFKLSKLDKLGEVKIGRERVLKSMWSSR